jgi:hypothetical protein
MWCKEPFELDPSLAALGFRCPHCGDDNHYETMKDPFDSPHAFDIHRHSSPAIADDLYSHSLIYVTEWNGQLETASGVVVEICSRLFLATASHTIRPNAGRRVQFVSKRPGLDGLRVPIIAQNKLDQDYIDVGVLELARSDSFDQLGVEPLPLVRVSDMTNGDATSPARVLGYPDEWIKPTRTSAGMQMGCLAQSLGSFVVAPEHWKAVEKETNYPQIDRDIVLSFDRNSDYIDYTPELGLAKAPPNPRGMSGGGIWQPPERLRDGEIWHPERSHLIGIQYDWPTWGRFLRAVQIIHWLKLVADTFPELSQTLHDLYPRLGTIQHAS